MTPGQRLMDTPLTQEGPELATLEDEPRSTRRSRHQSGGADRAPIHVEGHAAVAPRDTAPEEIGPRLRSVDEDGAEPEVQPAWRAPDDSASRARTVRVSIVIPALNEAKNLPHVLPHIPSDVHEVILVDGGSVDGTIDVARALLPRIRVVTETRPGKGAALCAGFRAAKGDIIVTLDADGSTDPREIPRFVDALLAGADFAKGSRFLANGGSTDISRLRAFGNFGFVVLVRALFGGRYTDLCYGYNAFWTSVLPTLALDGGGFEIETMMNVRALRQGLRITEVPSFEQSRIHGVSNLRTFRDGWRVLRTILSERLPVRPPSVGWDSTSNSDDFGGSDIGASPRRRLVPVMDPVLGAETELAFERRVGVGSNLDPDFPVRMKHRAGR